MGMIFKNRREKKDLRGFRPTRKDLIVLTLSVIIVLFVLNFLSSRHFFRLDLTKGNEYTLSSSTKEVLKGLDDIVNVRIYFSKDLPPALLPLKRDVDDMLDEYRTYAGSKLNVQYTDPQESPQIEQQVQMMGIPPVQLNVVQRDKQEVARIYLGMAVVHGDKKEIIPVIQRAQNLEYDLTAAILQVSREDKPVIKWLSVENSGGFKEIKEYLKRRYTIKDASTDDLQLDPAEDALLVLMADGELTDSNLFEIDQYLMNGGKVMAMVDRMKIGNNLQVSKLETDSVIDWLKNNKIEVEDKFLLDGSNTHAAFNGGYVTYHVPYPFWVKVTRDGFDKDNPMVSEVDSLILPWVSPLEITADNVEGVTYSVLAKSSPYNNVANLDGPLVPEANRNMVGNRETTPRPLVVLATGKLVSAFGKDRKAPPVKDAKVVESAEDAQLLVVGNTRFIQDNFLREFVANSVFFENAIDSLAMGNELIGIRSKGATDRPIGQLSPATVAFIKYVNILGGSLVMMIVGFIVIFLRRQKRRILKVVYQ